MVTSHILLLSLIFVIANVVPCCSKSLFDGRHVHRRYVHSVNLVKSLPISEVNKKFLVDEHNRYRRMVPATNIRKLSWSNEIAVLAQMWADQCIFEHTPETFRISYDLGENIHAASYPDITNAVFLWYNEINDPTCGCTNTYKHCCGHYTQVTWATSTLVGCGMSECSSIAKIGNYERYILVCQYRSRGNWITPNYPQQAGFPAFTYRNLTEPKCSGCPAASICDDGLCA